MQARIGLLEAIRYRLEICQLARLDLDMHRSAAPLSGGAGAPRQSERTCECDRRDDPQPPGTRGFISGI